MYFIIARYLYLRNIYICIIVFDDNKYECKSFSLHLNNYDLLDINKLFYSVYEEFLLYYLY